MICRLSARSSNSIPDLHGLDVATLSTLAEEVMEREERDAWSNVHELIARVYDLLSIMRVEALALGGVKRYNLPEPTRMPRPGQDVGPVTVSPREAALMMMAGA